MTTHTTWKDPVIEPPPLRRVLMIFTNSGAITSAIFRTAENGQQYYQSGRQRFAPGLIRAYIPAPDVPEWAKDSHRAAPV
jgi:hypothetical protein